MQQERTRKQDPRLVALHLWSTVHGLVNLSRSQRLEMVEQNHNDSLIQRTMESMLQCIFN